jgi:hypothetical protein
VPPTSMHSHVRAAFRGQQRAVQSHAGSISPSRGEPLARLRMRGHRHGFDFDVQGRDWVIIYAILALSVLVLVWLFR